MARETVDFGIDLGTTNSAVAVSTGVDASVVRNNLQLEYTPSAVRVSRSGQVHVGSKARESIDADPANTHAEFKLEMGVREAHRTFAASGRLMTPEELSAEVLKSLRRDVSRSLDEEIPAAVITVPAAFELDQCDATRRAAALAGLEFAPLIQEPTAAAWAYSAAAATRAAEVPGDGFWLVYDFGGGTFDAAVIQVRDGEFTVVNHAGDNFLGGKLIDWGLVEKVLVPAVHAEVGGDRASLDRSDPGQARNIAKLKLAAENAKIELSHSTSAEVDLELHDDDGTPFDVSLEVVRADVDRVAQPLYRRSVELCRAALAEKRLAPGDVERVLLVGGATLAPALRELLADPGEGLGIPLDHSLDPVTVVARGAAIFARTQRLPRDLTRRAAPAGHVTLDFQHQPTGRGTDPLVGGRAQDTGPQDNGPHDTGAPERDWSGHTIEFTRHGRPPWTSGQLPLAPDGTFATRLNAPGTAHTYTIVLRDPLGTTVPTDPETTSYQRMAMEGGDSTLSHSVGVWTEGNEVTWILGKGAELPASMRIVLESTVDVRRGERTGLIRVPVVEGERERADRNTVVGQLDIRPDEVKRDVPAGSEIEVAVTIDRSYVPHVDAYIPILDEEFAIAVELGRSEAADRSELCHRRDTLTAQYQGLRERAAATRPPAARATELLDMFDQRGLLAQIDELLAPGQLNPDAPASCQVLLRTAELALDEVEEALRLPQLVDDAESTRDWVTELVEEAGDAGTRAELRRAERELDSAVATGDGTVVTHQTEVVRQLGLRVLDATGQLPAVRFAGLRDAFATATDPAVLQLLSEGESALARGDANRLRSITRELARLLPAESGALPGEDVSTTVRSRR